MNPYFVDTHTRNQGNIEFNGAEEIVAFGKQAWRKTRITTRRIW